MKKFHIFLPIVLLVLFVLFFFKLFFLQGKLPIPSDTIIGLYHPFRDLYAKDNPRGIQFKNFLITDPVRQQYPWRDLAISQGKTLQLPFWNPYSAAGTPLLGNFQSAVFYPLNFLFFLLPFSLAWSLLIVIQPLLGGLFLYFYLVHMRLNKWASVFGAMVFSFSGFNVAWLEWNTIGHVALWLPLILLSIDKIVSSTKYRKAIWLLILFFSLSSSFFAGHLQTFFYLYVLSLTYFVCRWFQFGRPRNILFLFIVLNSLFIIITSVQWFPTLQFIGESARGIDQFDWQKEGWFLPWQHLVQFVVPDFFGNPTTLNYWGVWNYAEFIGYVGILPLVISFFALFFRRDKKTLFFGSVFFFSLVFSLPTIFAKIPYFFHIPFVSTAQSTRLLFLVDFSLAVLTAFGFDYFLLSRKKHIVVPVGFFAFIYVLLWGFVLLNGVGVIGSENLSVARRNLVFPTLMFIISAVVLFILIKLPKVHRHVTMMTIIIVAIVGFDLLRFALKFTPFTNKEYLFPQTKVTSFLQKQQGQFRIMTTDSRILPPNFSLMYRLQSVDGYDPLYLRRYGELIVASERGEANINLPFGFNRIITPHRYDSKIIDLLGVKYILSLSDLSSPKLTKVFQEGETRIYENKQVLPRVFFVEDREEIVGENKQSVLQILFNNAIDMRKIAVIEGFPKTKRQMRYEKFSIGKAEIVNYEENSITIKTENEGTGFLVLTDSFYPTWHAKVDGVETKIYRTDYNFRGIFVPKGKHTIEFYNSFL